MAYTPTTWNTGDTITATKLNKLENGVANAGSALICDVNNNTLNKTVQEIYDALLGGIPVYVKYQYGALDSAYVGAIYLAPIVKIYNYDYNRIIRLIALKPSYSTISKGNVASLFSPGTMIFSASGLNQYPEYYNSLEVGESYVNTTSI